MTRIPELEQELVAAAARLQSPRRVLRRARWPRQRSPSRSSSCSRSWERTEKDRADRGRQPTGTPPRSAARRSVIDAQAGVRLSLEGRVLTVGLLPWTPERDPRRVSRCADPRHVRGGLCPGGPRGRSAQRARGAHPPLAGRPRTLRFRFARDISKIARWCRVEDPAVGHVAFVKFGSEPVGPLSATQTIEVTEEGVHVLLQGAGSAGKGSPASRPTSPLEGRSRSTSP